MKVLVQVSKDDIANGQACNCTKCPVALAINRAVPTCLSMVGPRGCHLYQRLPGVVPGAGLRDIDLPEKVRKWIERFDNAYRLLKQHGRILTNPAKPFSFEIEVPSCLMKSQVG